MQTAINTEPNDLAEIFSLFDHSVAYQEARGYPVRRNYDKSSDSRCTLLARTRTPEEFPVYRNAGAQETLAQEQSPKSKW